MSIIKKIESIFNTKEIQVEGAEVWLVKWKARNGEFCSSYDYKAKAFLNEDDAKHFISNLKDAQKLLCYTEDIEIKLEHQ